MDISSLIGAIIGVVSILIGQALEGGNIGQLLQITAALIVFGGTIGGVVLSFSKEDLIGAIIAFIEASTGRRPDIILGKPYRGIVEEALQVTGFAKENLAMVGDRLYTDIATGVNFGMTSILVLSGETTQSMLDASEIRPSAVFGRLSDMIPYL